MSLFTGLRRARPLLVLLMAAAPLVLPAQDIIMSQPKDPLLPSSVRELAPPPPLSRVPSGPATPFQLGPIIFHPRLSYSFISADGLPTRAGQRIPSEIHTTNAGVTVDLGRNWALEYNPSWINYSAESMSDSFNQSVSLSGATSFKDVGFTFAESYSKSKPTLVETARQTEQETWATSVSTNYSFSPKLQLQGSAGVNERYTDTAPSTRSWNGQVRMNWRIDNRLNLALGPGFTYTELAHAADTYGESYTGQVNWRPVDKLSITLDGGVQSTHSNSAAGVDLSTPILDLSIGYQPLPTTGLSLTVARTVSNSYFKDQVTENFRWNLGLQQRLLGHFYLNATYGRYTNDYAATNTNTTTLRSDVVETMSARLTTQLVGRVSVALTYQDTRNNSNLAEFTFSTKQYGIELSCQF